jgi:small-conductance mechanosensitive channel
MENRNNFKISPLGIEDDSSKPFWQKLIYILLYISFVITAIILLKKDALPLVGGSGLFRLLTESLRLRSP